MNKNLRPLRKKFFQKRIPEYRGSPVLFAREVLLFEPDEWQKTALMDLAENPKVAIKSGQGVGKTGLEAVALLWFLCCFPYPRIVATAPTKQQLHDVLWSEISKWMSRSPLLSEILKWTKTYIYMKGNEKRWFAVARTATKPENMQGFHEDNMLFIIDEASGVADPIMEAVLGTLSGENNKLLMCGNPTRNSGTFFDAFNADRAQYQCHTVSSRNSPRTNKDNIASLDRKYGKDSNVVRVRVDGEFPEQDDDVFIILSIIEQCGSKIYELSDDASHPFIVFGVDVARFGDDETAIYRNARGKLKLVENYKGQDLMWTVGNIVKQYKIAIEDYADYKGYIYVNIDDTGLGGGVTDRLREVKREQKLHRLVIVPINAAEKIPTDTKEGKDAAEYYNDITTHMWAVLKDLLENKQTEIEDNSETFAQLSTRKYFMASNGKLQLESKKEIKKRGLPSPDRADAAALSVYLGKIQKYTHSPISDAAVKNLGKSSYWRK
ncbi:MAG: DEAD/DEAH box helicase family protein [Eubacterium sp.]|nr:DEAD/DEAH box helicase family protein [Eubacterium sp.]